MQRTQRSRRTAGLALILALAVLPGGAFASTGFQPQAAKPTSGGGYIDRSGFGELVYRSILEGYLVGTELGIAMTDFQNDPATSVRAGLGGLLGAATGLALPLVLSRGEVRSGDVALMGAAQGIGMANGYLIPLTIQLLGCGSAGGSCSFFASANPARIDFGISAALSLGAGAATILVAHQFNLSPGQAEAMGSAAIWGAAVGFLLTNSVPNAILNNPSLLSGAAIAGADAGFLAAFLLRDFFDMDRSRIWFIDLGVSVGAGAGWALAFFISPGQQTSTSISIAVLAGMVAGWGVAYYATSGLDGFRQNAPPAAVPVTLGAPTLRPLASLARGERSTGVQLDVLQGTF